MPRSSEDKYYVAALSLAHYREAHRARSTAEFVSKLNGGLQELEETAYWLELLSEAEILETNHLKSLIQETQELIAIFVTLIKNAKTKSLNLKPLSIFRLHPSAFRLQHDRFPHPSTAS